MLLILVSLLIFNPSTTYASDLTSQGGVSPKLKLKVAKNYSNKFCNAIGIGLSPESAMSITIDENTNPAFNPSLWFDIALSGKEDINSIEISELAKQVSENVVESCGYPLGLRGKEGIDEFEDFFTKNMKSS